MIIPREGRLVRIYCQLREVVNTPGSKFDRLGITEKTIFEAAKKILKPYTLDYKHCDNWTAYQIGQRVGDHFSVDNRIFLAGDAVHTHSPKAGQGMNVSMQDTYNLGWKLALVLKGFARRELLSTYEEERRALALELIAFDKQYSKLWSSRSAKDNSDEGATSVDAFKEAFIKQKLFSSGFAVDYGPYTLVVKESHQISDGSKRTSKQHLATNIQLGKRFPNARVVNQSDGRPWEFAKWLKADGRFRIILFAGRVANKDQMQRVSRFCLALEQPGSLLQRHLPSGETARSYVELLTIHSAPREAVGLVDFPELLHPFDEEYGWDYDKIFADDESYYEPYGQAYMKLGVDEQRGCVVVARPDQHVGWIGDLEDIPQLEAYFEPFLAV